MRKDRTRVRPLIEYRHWIELDSLTYIYSFCCDWITAYSESL